MPDKNKKDRGSITDEALVYVIDCLNKVVAEDKKVQYKLENGEIFIKKSSFPGYRYIRRLLNLKENKIKLSNGKLDVNGDIRLEKKGYKKLPFAFEYVSGNFRCDFNRLVTLEGSPVEIDGNFSCSNNKLKTLTGAPKKVTGAFICCNNQLTSLVGLPDLGHFSRTIDCSHNNLTTLKGSPEDVFGGFFCDSNMLTTLYGCPKTIGADFNCSANELTNLKDAPKTVGGNFFCQKNKIESLDGFVTKVGGKALIDVPKEMLKKAGLTEEDISKDPELEDIKQKIKRLADE